MHRHFFHLAVDDGVQVPDRWLAGDATPSGGGPAVRWECWWLPLERAHVLACGQGLHLGRLWDDAPRPA